MSRVKYLVLDAAPLIETSAASLRGRAITYVTTQDVLNEIRDKTSRDLLQDTDYLGLGDVGAEKTGLQTQEPSAEALLKVTSFAKLTGDIAVLSKEDIRIIALTLTLEIQENGLYRVRPEPGKPSQFELDKAAKKARLAERKQAAWRAKQSGSPLASTSSHSPPSEHRSILQDDVHPDGHVPEQGDHRDESGRSSEPEPALVASASNEGEHSGDESDSSAGSWITPENVIQHKVRDQGLFGTLAAQTEQGSTDTLRDGKIKSACMTGDYAMQNVMLQMGLNVLGSAGKLVTEVRTWILRCHACFKLCKDPAKKFCPSCGNDTLLRTSITYVPASPDNPRGYILHLKKNFQYRNRGTIYSIPSPKPGSAKPSQSKQQNGATLILREDQKEYQRGLRRAEILKAKEDKALAKAIARGGPNATLDWEPAMLMGHHAKGRRADQHDQVGKDGLPVIGYRRNPNQTRRATGNDR
ncbi:uncharacterized protein L969DRAFT_91674 [Mixia osmundae IAM 14324]|uniref:20S-pre-rRNA D-site endonuclease NOB1 n=1 Tax=Mixia osmundae (strain CBS 9802 / IAM 14324 / JCM 22182 / KY 12970) TaxID=764103 RepID=G7E065_MIXOS|nr:uncharacterized protein L969DRAFT_91674 [Mixia osmundae IAM 14324]KEI42215.1 hypothetical protein L969DRAFT_91674 [Mixia osmundae IAM 14324]GAA96225.1 hypothetical protein E5Q_02889 [Mixia osmundae IAM 14324]